MEFKDYFSTQSEVYAKSRPHYPDELFRFLASLAPAHDLAWDCATGNGQAATVLANYFSKVIATDGSAQQIKNAVPHEKVTYAVALADDSGIEPGTVDLVTIAAALHWMDFDKLYKEVKRVLKPGGIFAGWTYCDSHVSDALDPIIHYLSKEILGSYWPPERAYVENYYRNIPFPFKPISTPEFKISVMAGFDFLLGYLNSWSSTQSYIKINGKNPIELVRKQLENAWGDISKNREITWALTLKVGKKD